MQFRTVRHSQALVAPLQLMHRVGISHHGDPGHTQPEFTTYRPGQVVGHTLSGLPGGHLLRAFQCSRSSWQLTRLRGVRRLRWQMIRFLQPDGLPARVADYYLSIPVRARIEVEYLLGVYYRLNNLGCQGQGSPATRNRLNNRVAGALGIRSRQWEARPPFYPKACTTACRRALNFPGDEPQRWLVRRGH